MALPLVSIILPCYNASRTLAEAVCSIQTQTLQEWELLILDDGSTDDSLAVARSLAAGDPRIEVKAYSHASLVPTLEAGRRAARGRYLARMDADDVSRAQRLEQQVYFMHGAPDVAICGTQVRIVGPEVKQGLKRYETWVNSVITHEDIVKNLFVECPLPHPTWMVRKELLDAVGGYQDLGWAEDYDLVLRLYEAGARFGKVQAVLLDWRHSGSRLSMTDRRYSRESFIAVKQHYLRRTYLRNRKTLYQWGAGEVGKAWLRTWQTPKPLAVIDINPRKIGRVIHGTPVVAPEDLSAPGGSFIVVAVGAPGARDEIRAWFQSRRYQERKDYVFVA